MLRSLCFRVPLCHSSCGPSDQPRLALAILSRWLSPAWNGIHRFMRGVPAITRWAASTTRPHSRTLSLESWGDGSGRLLDIGCGPGKFTLLMAPLFEQATGLDAGREMLAEAERRATHAGVGNVQWLHLRAEELPAGLGRYRALSFAQSFHWVDQLQVARVALGMLEVGGACVHVHANTHEGVETDAELPHPRPPHPSINELVERYLGPIARNRKGLLWADKANREEEVWRAAGFSDLHRIEVSGDIVERTSDQIVAAMFSLSTSTPHLFGERRAAFEADLRRLLHDANPSGIFSDQMREIAADIWRPRKG
jgi:SAM-dependent methyltransferase